MHETFFDKDAVYMVLDYMCYDLERLLINFHEKLIYEDIRIILSQIFRGVLFLHENNMIHRVFYNFFPFKIHS
jgi:serine/threonine protein kinase